MRDELDQDAKDEVSAFLISGGGNDIVGKVGDLQALLNPAGSAQDINANALKQRVDVALRKVLENVLFSLDELATLYLGRPVPIYLHGYAYPVPDGRPGPRDNWLKPAFDQMRYTNRQQCTDIMMALIDHLNAMQIDVANNSKLASPVHHVDLRPALSNVLAADADKAHWQNELHPTIPLGFQLVSDLFARELNNAAPFNALALQSLSAALSTSRTAPASRGSGSSPR